MTVLRTKVNGLWTDIAGDVSPVTQVPQNVLDFVAFWTPTAWTRVTFQNGFTDYGLGYHWVEYRKAGDIGYLRGAMKNGSIGPAAFTLPVGFRPTNYMEITVSSWGLIGIVMLDSLGVVTLKTPSDVRIIVFDHQFPLT